MANKKEKIVWKTVTKKIKDLIPADYNPRKITAKQKQELRESIENFSEVEPLVANLNDRIIGGHQRLELYIERGIEETDVRVPNRLLTPTEEKELNLRLNKNVAEWDTEKLHDHFDVEQLLSVGFGDEELSSMWDNVEITDDNFNPAKAVEEAKATKVKLGDVYQLGEHRLMCGDSTKEEDVQTLLAQDKATMIYCDPPYNIGISYDRGVGEKTKGKFGGKYKDNKKEKDFKEFLGLTIKNALKHSAENAHFFYWCDETRIGVLQSLYEENGIKNEKVCLWIKNNAFPKPEVTFNKVYEPCVYGKTGRPFRNPNYKNLNEVLNKEVGTGNQLIDDILGIIDIWLVKKDATQDYQHPTQKPLNLHEKPLKRCTGPGAIVLDLFGGSGSTLISCEQLGRKARLMELDPVFCQVIINRYEEYTNKKAVKL